MMFRGFVPVAKICVGVQGLVSARCQISNLMFWTIILKGLHRRRLLPIQILHTSFQLCQQDLGVGENTATRLSEREGTARETAPPSPWTWRSQTPTKCLQLLRWSRPERQNWPNRLPWEEISIAGGEVLYDVYSHWILSHCFIHEQNGQSCLISCNLRCKMDKASHNFTWWNPLSNPLPEVNSLEFKMKSFSWRELKV